MTDDIVGCILDGRSQYMRESECIARGGRVDLVGVNLRGRVGERIYGPEQSLP
jgi:hypothetical protein